VVMMTYLHICSRLALRWVDAMITVSEYSKQDILNYCRIPASKIKAITHGPDPALKRVVDQQKLEGVKIRYGLNKPFVLADALKNPAVILRAWALLPENVKQDWQIVFFSRIPNISPALHEAENSGYARVLIKAPFEDLVALYSLARIFLFPSWYEGLGLPILEAMTCGAPVIASDRAAVPEIVSHAGLLMDAEDEVKLAQLITCLYENPVEQEKLRQAGYERAAEFSWQNVVGKVMNCYEDAIKNH